MARIRSLKPGFFTNEHLAELSFGHRLLFAGLWTIADREGRLEDRPRRIKAAVFPYDDVDVNRMLDDLAAKEFVVRYTADGVACLAIPTFGLHQRPKQDETASAIPAPLLTDPRGNVTGPRSYKGQRDLGSGILTGEEGGADGAPASADGVDASSVLGEDIRRRAEDFAAAWNDRTRPPIPRCRDLTTKRRRQIRSRLTERPLTEWQLVFTQIQQSTFCRGDNQRGWVATLDWVIGSPDVAVKVLEGKYDDRPRASPVDPKRAARIQELRDADRVEIKGQWYTRGGKHLGPVT